MRGPRRACPAEGLRWRVHGSRAQPWQHVLRAARRPWHSLHSSPPDCALHPTSRGPPSRPNKPTHAATPAPHPPCRPAVNTDRRPVPDHAYANVTDPSNHPVDDVLVINHYVVRSLEEFKFKMSRGSAMKTG